MVGREDGMVVGEDGMVGKEDGMLEGRWNGGRGG